MLTGRLKTHKFFPFFFTFLSGMVLTLILLSATPALAYHFPWDQNHDTTIPQKNEAPTGTCKSGTCTPCNSAGSPVYIPTGHFFWTETDVLLPGRPGLGLNRTYNSHDPRDGLFGNGWSSNCEPSVFKTVTVDADSGELKTAYILLSASGKRYEYSVDDSGNAQTPEGRYDELVPRENGTLRLEKIDGSYRVFDATGLLLSRVDRNGNAVHYDYDAQQRITRMNDEQGRFLDFTYNAAGRVATITDHGGRQWHYRYDDKGNLVAVTNPEGGERRYQYRSFTSSADSQTYQQLETITDASGVDVVNVTYNQSRVTSYTEGENRYSYHYDLAGQTVVKTDSANARRTYQYNDDQVITKIAEADGNGGTDVTSYTYDANGNRTRIIDPAGEQWLFDYDDQGRILSETNPQDETIRYDYEGQQPWPVRITSPSGRATRMSYDERGNALTVTDPMGDITSMEWNQHGDLFRVTDSLGRSMSFTYNSAGLVTSVTDPEQRTQRFEYDELGRQIQVNQPGGEIQRWQYDALGRVISVVNGLGDSSGFTYDAAGRQLQVTDWAGESTTFDYDSFGRLIEERRPDGQVTQYRFSVANNLTLKIQPDSTQVEYGYDRKHRLIQLSLPSETYQYRYNSRDQLTRVTQSSNGWTSEYGYDAAGRRISETHNGRSIAVELNADGEAARWTVDGESQTLSRNDRGQVTALQTPAGDYRFDYDSAGQLVSLDYPGGTAHMSYNNAGQFSRQQFGDSQGTDFRYSYDENGRVAQRQGEGVDWFYDYDPANRLVSASHGEDSHEYLYDANGNRLEDGQQYDAFNKLLSSNNVVYEHDARGNRIRETHHDTGDVTEYDYDARNRLTGARHYPEGADSPAWTASYAYDASNRRIAKTVTGQIEKNVEYLWAGSRLVAEYHDGASTPSKSYRYSDTGFAPLSYSEGSHHLSVHSDYLDTPKVLTNQHGTTVWNTVLSPYGQTTENRDPDGDAREVTFNPRFPGQYHDRETGLHYNWHRTYDPATGRYLQSDPLGITGGLNTYTYAANNPISFTDSRGLFIDALADIGFIAYDLYRIAADNIFRDCDNLGSNLAALGADIGGLFVPAGTGFGMVARAGNKAVTKGANKAPDFVVSPGGTAFPVPKGATGPTPVVNPGGKTTGSAFTGGKGGANGQVDTMRIMNPTPPSGKSPGYPSGYIKYQNKSRQGVDPYTGRTLSNKDSHFSID